MTSVHFRSVALTAAVIALTASPALAQRDGRNGREGRREGVERAQPRRGGEPRGRVGRTEPRRSDRVRGGRDWNDNRSNGGRAYRNRGDDNRWNNNGRNDNRRYDSRAYGNRWRDNRADNWRGYGNRAYGYGSHGRPYDTRAYRYRSYDYGRDGYRRHGYGPHVYRSYGVPYGYRPHGYRHGWSLNLYFGRPYFAYGYGAYDYPAGYGYYSLIPGRAYGALRIVDAPRDARVFVDGYYAGVVDDYDGVFQHLNLEAGPHNIEIEMPGYPPFRFDVYIEPGRTVTYRVPGY